MTTKILLGGLALTFVGCTAAPSDNQQPQARPSAAAGSSPSVPAADVHPGLLYGRITGVDGATYEGRLRWGRDQEASWDDYFKGTKSGNAWAAHAPRPRDEGRRIEIFGIEFGGGPSIGLRRPFMAPFGDLARIDLRFAEVQVTLKSGTSVTLDRFSAGDADDGVRVWDATRGVVDLDTHEMRTVEFLPATPFVSTPTRLHGTVRTPRGDFSGFVQWDRRDGVSTDTLDGRTGDRDVSLPYDSIRTIARRSRDSTLVTLRDGRELVLSPARRDNRGVYVDDVRYGRVLIVWDALERVDFTPSAVGPRAYGDFPAGRALNGSVTTRDGRRVAGRLVYDFDESETTETLDVSVQGVDYHIPFDRIASIVPPGRDGRDAAPGRVILRGGEELRVERGGDLGDQNAGTLIFAAGRQKPEYVPWPEIRQIDFSAAGR